MEIAAGRLGRRDDLLPVVVVSGFPKRSFNSPLSSAMHDPLGTAYIALFAMRSNVERGTLPVFPRILEGVYFALRRRQD